VFKKLNIGNLRIGSKLEMTEMIIPPWPVGPKMTSPNQNALITEDLAEIQARRAYHLAEESLIDEIGQTIDLLIFGLDCYGLEVTQVRQNQAQRYNGEQ